MKPFHDYDLGQVIANRNAAACRKIDNMSNEVIMANAPEILAENIYQEFFIEPVTIYEENVSQRSVSQGKIRRYIRPEYRDYPGKEYVEVDGVITTFFYPYTGEADLFKCRASTFSFSPYPEIDVYKDDVAITVECPLDEINPENMLSSVEQKIRSIREGVALANSDVESFNRSLKYQAQKWLEDKKYKVEKYYRIAAALEVPVEKKAYAATHIPLQRKIVPVARQYDRSDYYCIADADYTDILETIKHTGSTYEQTPASLKGQEEDLRNLLLASLNAIYKGDAAGERFRNKGKTDICIERENRAAFVAECKMWTGPKAVGNAIEQLDGYLTWRDCKTALIYFVKKKEFLKILETAENALRACDGLRSVYKKDKNEFDCTFSSKSNPGQLVRMRVMLFNLYCVDET